MWADFPKTLHGPAGGKIQHWDLFGLKISNALTGGICRGQFERRNKLHTEKFQTNQGSVRESRIEMNGSDRMVTHPGTNLAQPGLTLCSLKGQVLSTGPQVPSNYHNNSRENNALNRLVFFDLQINVSIAWQSGARRWLYMVWGPASVSPEPFVGKNSISGIKAEGHNRRHVWSPYAAPALRMSRKYGHRLRAQFIFGINYLSSDAVQIPPYPHYIFPFFIEFKMFVFKIAPIVMWSLKILILVLEYFFSRSLYEPCLKVLNEGGKTRTKT